MPTPDIYSVYNIYNIWPHYCVNVIYLETFNIFFVQYSLIKLWDLRKTHSGGRREPQCQNSLEYGGKSSHRGFTSLTLSQTRDMLYTSCMDDVIYAYHLVNPTPKPGRLLYYLIYV